MTRQKVEQCIRFSDIYVIVYSMSQKNWPTAFHCHNYKTPELICNIFGRLQRRFILNTLVDENRPHACVYIIFITFVAQSGAT